MIYKCTCQHDYQDVKYGKQNRVWVPTTKGRRCSVCGTTIIDDRCKEISTKNKKGAK